MKKIYLILLLFLSLIFSGCIHQTYGTKESGYYKGRLLDYDIEDGCGDMIWCQTQIWLDTGHYWFGEPCHIVQYLEKNATYYFYYQPFENMDCSGDYFWDIRISEIRNSMNETIWVYSGFEG